MSQEIFEFLLDRYMTGELSAEEKTRLAEMIDKPQYAAVLEGFVRKIMLSDDFTGSGSPEVKTGILTYLDKAIAADQRSTFRMTFLRRCAAAAVLLLSLGGILYFARPRPRHFQDKQPVDKADLVNDAAPGGNKAKLTLANGSVIVLDSAHNGMIGRQANAAIVKLDDGRLAYQAAGDPGHTAEIAYNILSTPRGGQYQLTLPDGSQIWLNAASSIRYPTAFTGKERKVEISGEAYFEVAKNPAKPFTVSLLGRPVSDTSRQAFEVEVLGTHFDIMAYADDPAYSTTLLEGSVRVTKGGVARTITPGQQLISTGQGPLQLMPDADIQKTIAWKNGKFMFLNDDIGSVMRQLARWYDIDVRMEAPVTDHYTGNISRQVNISQVLKVLEAAGGISFSVKGKEVKVLPKKL